MFYLFLMKYTNWGLILRSKRKRGNREKGKRSEKLIFDNLKLIGLEMSIYANPETQDPTRQLVSFQQFGMMLNALR